MGIIAMLPWWAGCALALVSYVLLHRVASRIHGSICLSITRPE